MPSAKTRVALAGGKHLVKHPRSRLTRFVVRFAARRVGARIATATHAEAIPATRGSRLTTVGGVVVVAGGIVVLVRRSGTRGPAASAVVVPVPHAPVPAAAPVAPAAAAAPPSTPSTSPAAEAARITAVEAVASELGDGDAALVARVRAELFGGTPPLGVTVQSNAGVVTLRGQVADEEAEVRFVRDAERIEGVKAVQSELVTSGDGPAADPASS